MRSARTERRRAAAGPRRAGPTELRARWRSPHADSWWPQVSPTGRFVSFGGGAPRPTGGVRCVDLQTGSIRDYGTAIRHLVQIGWWNDDSFVAVDKSVDLRQQLYLCNAVTGAFTKMGVDPALSWGNWQTATPGHWAASWVVGFCIRLFFDGTIAPRPSAGCHANGSWIISAGPVAGGQEGRGLHRWKNGVLHSTNIRSHSAFQISDQGVVSYGYFNPMRLWFPDGQDVDATITPDGLEGIAAMWHVGADLWLWSGAEIKGKPYIVGRTFGEARGRAIALPNFGAVHVSICFKGDHFIVAANDARGQLQIAWVSTSAARTDLTKIGTPDEPEEPEEPVTQPKTPPYGDYVKSQWLKYGSRTQAGAARFTRLMADSIHHGKRGFDARDYDSKMTTAGDPRCGLYQNSKPWGHDGDKLCFNFSPGLLFIDIVANADGEKLNPPKTPSVQYGSPHWSPNDKPASGSGKGWIRPKLQAGDDDDNGEPPIETHRYDGGGNDTGVCDVCGKSRTDPIHAIPQAREPHVYDGGEDDTGLCDVCGRSPADPIHLSDQQPPSDDLKVLKTRVDTLEAEDRKHQTEISRLRDRLDEIERNPGGATEDQIRTIAINAARDTVARLRVEVDVLETGSSFLKHDHGVEVRVFVGENQVSRQRTTAKRVLEPTVEPLKSPKDRQ